MDNAKRRPIPRFPTKLNNKGWKNFKVKHGQEIFIDQVLIHEQLGISKEGVVDATNATFEEAKTALERIVGPHVENEH
jgi:hypothetical protein